MFAEGNTFPSPAPFPWPVVSAPPAAVVSPPAGGAWSSAAPYVPAVPPPHADKHKEMKIVQIHYNHEPVSAKTKK